MQFHEILLITIAVAIVGVDMLIRLRLAPTRRDGWLQQLAFISLGVSPAASGAQKRETPVRPVAHSLLKYFEQSFASRHIVAALADAPRGMTQEELEGSFTDLASRNGKRALPPGAIRKVVRILKGADFVSLSGGKLQMTDLGWSLHALLRSRERG